MSSSAPSEFFKSTYPGNGADYHQAPLVRGIVDLLRRDASPDLERRALGPRRGLVLRAQELDVLQVQGPDRQRATGRALGVEVVARVLDVEADVEVAGEVHRELDLGNL